MKTLVISAIFTMALSGYSFTSAPETAKKAAAVNLSQQTSEFTYFRGHKQGKSNVVLNWGVNSIAGISGFVVERSYDGDFFEPINELPCGGALKHSCKDMNVFPGYIHYRIGCVMSDGSIHYTQVEIVRIVSHG